jgi:lipopolysaccharide assembly outer membrane protein LptD (OstA)
MDVGISMSRRYAVMGISATLLAMSAVSVLAQQSVEGFTISGVGQQRTSDVETTFTGGAVLKKDDLTIVADEMTVFSDRSTVVAIGNVVFRQGGTRVSAESATFNLRTRLSAFRRSSGVFAVRSDSPLYFYGETVEQLDSKTYRVTNGGFTTSTQPVPAWQLSSAAMVFSVK